MTFSGQKQSDALRLSINGSEVTLPAKIDTGIKFVKFSTLNVFFYFAKKRGRGRVIREVGFINRKPIIKKSP